MPGPALGPGHASPRAFPSTGRLPSTLSAPGPSVGVVRGFLGTIQPSDPSDLPVRLRLLAFPNRPGTAVAAAGGRRSPRGTVNLLGTRQELGELDGEQG